MDKEKYFWVFFVFWIALGIGGALFFYTSKNAGLKRTVFPIYSIFGSIVFISFGWFIGGSNDSLFFIVPFVSLITFLNIRNTKFCDNCGKTIYNRAWFQSLKECPKCNYPFTTLK